MPLGRKGKKDAKAAPSALPDPASLPAPKKDDDDDLPDSSDEESSDAQPLLDKGKAKSDAPPMSPRDMKDKMRERGGGPLTPRSKKKQMEAQAAAAMEDPAAAAEAAKKAAMENLDPAAAKIAAEAERMAKLAKEDPKAAAMEALEAAKNIKPPTAEELAASGKAWQEEAKRAQEASQKFCDDMIADRPPPCFPMEEVSAKTEKYVDMLIGAIPEGKIPPNVQEQVCSRSWRLALCVPASARPRAAHAPC